MKVSAGTEHLLRTLSEWSPMTAHEYAAATGIHWKVADTRMAKALAARLIHIDHRQRLRNGSRCSYALGNAPDAPPFRAYTREEIYDRSQARMADPEHKAKVYARQNKYIREQVKKRTKVWAARMAASQRYKVRNGLSAGPSVKRRDPLLAALMGAK